MAYNGFIVLRHVRMYGTKIEDADSFSACDKEAGHETTEAIQIKGCRQPLKSLTTQLPSCRTYNWTITPARHITDLLSCGRAAEGKHLVGMYTSCGLHLVVFSYSLLKIGYSSTRSRQFSGY